MKAIVLISSCFSLCFLLTTFAFTGAPIYENNSDIAMNMVVAGLGTSEQPMKHMLFSSTAIGALLKFLYSRAPSIHWYIYYFYTAQLIAFISVIAVLVSGLRARAALLISFCAVLAFSLRSAHMLEFTTLAGMLGIAGILVLLKSSEQKIGGNRFSWLLVAAFLLLVFSSAVRYQSAFLILLMTAAAITILFLGNYSACFLPKKVDVDHKSETRSRKKYQLKQVLTISSLFLLCSGGVFAQWAWNLSTYHSDPEWSEYPTLNSDFTNSFEYKRGSYLSPEVLSVWKHVGWSPADLLMAKNWYRLDKTVYSAEKLDYINKNLPRADLRINFENLCRDIVEMVSDVTIWPILGIAFLSLFLLDRNRCSIFSGILLFLAIFVFLLGISATMKLPPRVYSIVCSFFAMVLLFHTSTQKWEKLASLRNRWLWLFLAFISAISVPALLNYRERSIAYAEKYELLLDLKRRIQVSPDKLFVSWADAIPLGWIRPFDHPSDFFRDFKLVRLGVLARSPVTMSRLEEFGITDLLLQIDDPRIFLVSTEAQNAMLSEFMIQHYKRRPIFKNVYSDPRIPLDVFKVETTDDLRRENTDQHPDCPEFSDNSLVLFPGELDSEWRYVKLKLIERINGKTKFENKGAVPVITRNAPLDLEVVPGMGFAIEIAVNEWIVGHRKTAVQLQLDDGKSSETLIIPLLSDGGMHRYVYPLARLSLPAGTRITHINVLPLYTRPDYRNEVFEIGRFGIIYKQRVKAMR